MRVLVVCCVLSVQVMAQSPSMMTAIYRDSAEYGWANKKVIERRVLDGMTDPRTWAFTGRGKVAAGSDGVSPLLRVDVGVHEEGVKLGWGPPAVALTKSFANGEDWSRFNRVSFRIRARMTGFHAATLTASLRNDGKVKVPDVYQREGAHYITLSNNQWTDVNWEFEPTARDKVTSFAIRYWVTKQLPDASDRVVLEIGPVELQRVKPDHYEGWSVAPGKIAFSHTGYLAGGSKTAIANGLAATEFRVNRVDTGETVLRKPVQRVKNSRGEFQLLEFSEVRMAGSYVLQAGDVQTRPFRIADEVWSGTIWKTINFFYGERCGMAIPGVHGACHRDWFATLGDKKIALNGGWHDAGDLSQGLINTAEATYAMFSLARRMRARGQDPALVKRLIEEARWGLEWVMRVRFPGGYRMGFASMNVWTNGIVGDADDRSREALNNPNVNYLAASAEAMAYLVLKDSEPELAARALRLAEEDWQYAINGKEIPETQHTPAFAATEMELAAVGVLASLELYEATHKPEYAAKARELAGIVVDSQQRTFVGRGFPLAGFFYNSPAKQDIFHQFHRGNDQAPVVAMAKLCEQFPDDPNWMRWYSVVAYYSEYQKASVKITEPFGVLPSYVYKEDEWMKAVDGDRYQSSRAAYKEQVLGGAPMGEGYYLKVFPVWFGRRGNYGSLLSQGKGLSAAAHLRRDPAAADLAQRQLEWVVGHNPFSQSTMWGEGYDFAQQYSVSSGDFVGSLPVGMMTRGNSDLPYWPAQNSYVYKEVWVHPSARWLWMLEDLNGSGIVEGRVRAGYAGGVEFEDLTSGEKRTVHPDERGMFRIQLPVGRYRVRADKLETTVVLLASAVRDLDLRADRFLDMHLNQQTSAEGEVTIRLAVRGSGRHAFALRTDNVQVQQNVRDVSLKPESPITLEWKGRTINAKAPWVAVVIPDGDVMRRVEICNAPPQSRVP